MRWLLVLFLVGCCSPAAQAVEPLWGDMPLTLGKDTLHPVWRSRYRDAGSSNSSRMRMWEQELMLEYAPSAKVNYRLDLPYLNNLLEDRRGGRRDSAFVSGLGDITLRAKQRLSASRGDGRQSMHSLFYGLKLPTGASDKRFNSGPGSRRLDPIDQAGSGKPGILLGYGWTGETLQNAYWGSLVWQRDVGGGFRRGDLVEGTATAARWIKRANAAEELGIKLSLGVNGQYHTADVREGGGSAANEFGYLGLQLAPVITRSNTIFQAGILVPVLRTGVGHRTDFPFELRVGVETFF